MHHQNTDKEGDPHSPQDGGLWAHMGWIITGQAMHQNTAELLPYVPDLRKQKFYMWISRYHWVPITTLAVITLAFGGLSVMLWAVFLRTVLGLHSTWLVNSATHMWGSRRFITTDTSTNSFWVAILTFGEGWHNNHHAVPVAAKHGLAWYEIDMNWYGISTLRALGLAWDIKLNKLTPEAHDAQRAAAPAPISTGMASLPVLPTVVEEELVSGD
jgi:stearoyl-CoA desaturase (delta-9 desaturase)